MITDNDISSENRNTFPVMIISTAKADTLQRRMMIISKVTMTMILTVNRTDIFLCVHFMYFKIKEDDKWKHGSWHSFLPCSPLQLL